MSNENPSLKEIGYFRVTERSFETILFGLELSREKVRELPTGATVIDIGSSLNQSFAKGVLALRPDINAISIDPSLAISEKEVVMRMQRGGSGK